VVRIVMDGVDELPPEEIGPVVRGAIEARLRAARMGVSEYGVAGAGPLGAYASFGTSRRGGSRTLPPRGARRFDAGPPARSTRYVVFGPRAASAASEARTALRDFGRIRDIMKTMHGASSVTGEHPRPKKQRAQRRLDAIVHEHDAHRVALPASRALAILRGAARAIDDAHARGRTYGAMSLAAVAIEERTGRVILAPPRGGGDREADRASLLVVAEELLGKDVVARASPPCGDARTALAAVAAIHRAAGVEGMEDVEEGSRGERASKARDARVLRVLLLDPDSARQAEAMRAITAVYGTRVRVRTADDEDCAPDLVIVDGDRDDTADVVAELRARPGGDRLRAVAGYADPAASGWRLAILGVVDLVRHDDGEALKLALRAIGSSSGWRVRATSVPPSERRLSRPEPLEEVEDEPSPRRRRSSSSSSSRSRSRARRQLVPGLVVFAVASSAIFLAMALIARSGGRGLSPSSARAAKAAPAADHRTR